jgi:hypothetical protein
MAPTKWVQCPYRKRRIQGRGIAFHRSFVHKAPTRIHAHNTAPQVLALRAEHSDWTLAQIASAVRPIPISRERVRQVLRKAHLPTRRFIPQVFCADCGEGPLVGSEIRKYSLQDNPTTRLRLCSQCRWNRIWMRLTCAYDGKEVMRLCSRGQPPGLVFCDKRCHGLWMIGRRSPRRLSSAAQTQ